MNQCTKNDVDYVEKFRELVRMQETEDQAREKSDQMIATPLCPKCGAQMVLRTASKGANKGGQFYGCSKFPNCRGIRQI